MFTYGKNEKLKSKKRIEQLFVEGKSISVYPIRLVYLKTTLDDANLKAQTGVSVSKRYFKNAVDRNRVKRLLRECYRLNKPKLFNNITTQYTFMFLYIGKQMPEFNALNRKMEHLFKKFLTQESLDDEENT